MKYQLPMSSPDLSDLERDAVASVLESPVLSMGAHTEAFEKSIADFVVASHAIAVSSGTTGLHLCVRAADIRAGDLVFTTPFSFVASTNVLLYENAVPIFIDVDELTGNIDPVRLTEAARDLSTSSNAAERWLPRKRAKVRSPRAILTVDVFGQPADYDGITMVAQKHNLTLIEDSCEALGAQYKSRFAGTFGQCAVFAFYPNKQITTGEGGVIVTNDDDAADFMRALRNQGRAPGDTWLEHTHLGYNYRITEMSAALGNTQMHRLNELLAKRQQVADWYTRRIESMQGVTPPHVTASTTRMSWFVYVVRLAPHLDRRRIAADLATAGIPSRPYFTPIHLQPYMIDRFGYRSGDFPVTEDLGRRSLALPFSGVMTEDQVDLVCGELQKTLRKQ
jgi:perosamine synthetase